MDYGAVIREHLHAADTRAAQQAAQEAVKASPAEGKHRVVLFQLMCLHGEWERALGQLEVLAQLDAQALPMVTTYREAVRCEAVRASVFRGDKTPLAFGEPRRWVALLVEAVHAEARGDTAGASRLRAEALDEADMPAARVNGEAHEWIADADPRLGPVLEAIVNGKYYWMPLFALSQVTIEAPVDLRDLIWTPAQFRFVNGGEAFGLIPTRYPGAESDDDPLIRLARRTDWVELADGCMNGRGQRVLATDGGDFGLLDIRSVEVGAAGSA